MLLERLSSVDAVHERAAALLLEATRALRQTRGGGTPLTWGLCGGRSVAGVLMHLAREAATAWRDVQLYMADERCVPRGSPDWNGALIEAGLVTPLVSAGRMDAGQWHPFLADEGLRDSGTAAYSASLARHGGALDVLLLSAGEDGHFASLFPGHPALDDEADAYLLIDGSPKPPPRRLTASRALCQRATCTILLFTGEGKRVALERTLAEEGDWHRCPVRLFRGLPGVRALTDLDVPGVRQTR